MITFFATVRQSLAIAAMAAASGALISTPALADTVHTTAQTSVSYAGLDLSTLAGQAKMHNRMRAAARQVCGYDVGARDLGQLVEQNACIAQAMNGAQTELAAATTKTGSSQRVAVRDAGRDLPGRAR